MCEEINNVLQAKKVTMHSYYRNYIFSVNELRHSFYLKEG